MHSRGRAGPSVSLLPSSQNASFQNVWSVQTCTSPPYRRTWFNPLSHFLLLQCESMLGSASPLARLSHCRWRLPLSSISHPLLCPGLTKESRLHSPGKLLSLHHFPTHTYLCYSISQDWQTKVFPCFFKATCRYFPLEEDSHSSILSEIHSIEFSRMNIQLQEKKERNCMKEC